MPVNTLENHTSWLVMFTQILQEGGMPEHLQQKMCKREREQRKRKETCAELQLLEVFLLMLFDDKCLNQRPFTVTGVYCHLRKVTQIFYVLHECSQAALWFEQHLHLPFEKWCEEEVLPPHLHFYSMACSETVRGDCLA